MKLAEKLEKNAQACETAPTEEHMNETINGAIIAEKNVNEMVPKFSGFPANKLTIDYSQFSDVSIDTEASDEFKKCKTLDEFIALAPNMEPYEFNVTKLDENGLSIAASIVLIKENSNPDKKPSKKTISKVPYYHHIKILNLSDNTEGCIVTSFRDGKQKYLHMEMIDVAEPNKLKKLLASKGILVTNGLLNQDYIYNQNIDCKNIRYIYDTIGFNKFNDIYCYIYPKGKAIGTDANVYYSKKELELLNAVAVNGNIKIWLDNVIVPLNLRNELPVIAFLLFASITPLFSKLIPEFQGMIINIIPNDEEQSTSSTGKTTIQRLMLSFQGSQDWMSSWDTTANAIEAKLGDGFGTYLDDLSTSNIKNFEKIVYSNANGSQRARLNQNGIAKKVKKRKSVIFSSGEQKLLEDDLVKDGSLVRSIDVELKSSDFGSTDINKTKAIVDKIKETVYAHYGFVYRIVIPMILQEESLIIKIVRAYKEQLSSAVDDSLSKRLAIFYAITIVCGELLIIALQKLSNNKNFLSDLNPQHIVSTMFQKHSQALKSREDKHFTVLESIKQNIIISKENSDILDKYKNKIGIVEDNKSYIKSTFINEILKEQNNVITSRFFKWAFEKQILCEKDSDNTRFTKKKKIDSMSINTYVFNFNENSGKSGNQPNK